MNASAPVCVMCGEPSITTAAHIPVCQNHWDEYKKEAMQYPSERPVFCAMIEADKKRNAKIDSGVWFQSAASGLCYQVKNAGGDISAVKVDGVIYKRHTPYSRRRENG